jgi:hypothetical protein
MAIDILSILAMLSDLEQIFLGAQQTISWDRAKFGNRSTERTECLKSWVCRSLTAGIRLITVGIPRSIP